MCINTHIYIYIYAFTNVITIYKHYIVFRKTVDSELRKEYWF